MDPFLIILVLFVGAMWLMTRRSRKQQREAADFRANLEVGQEVMTGSGLYGTIVDVDGDVITLESTPGNETRWIRAAIAKLVPPAAETFDDDAEYEDEVEDEDEDVEGDTEYEHEADVADDDDRGARDRGATRLDRLDVPDDLSTMDERRTDDGTDRR